MTVWGLDMKKSCYYENCLENCYIIYQKLSFNCYIQFYILNKKKKNWHLKSKYFIFWGWYIWFYFTNITSNVNLRIFCKYFSYVLIFWDSQFELRQGLKDKELFWNKTEWIHTQHTLNTNFGTHLLFLM